MGVVSDRLRRRDWGDVFGQRVIYVFSSRIPPDLRIHDLCPGRCDELYMVLREYCGRDIELAVATPSNCHRHKTLASEPCPEIALARSRCLNMGASRLKTLPWLTDDFDATLSSPENSSTLFGAPPSHLSSFSCFSRRSFSAQGFAPLNRPHVRWIF